MNDPIRDVARVTIELESPMLIARGRGDFRADAVPVTDANGLPAIPGTSIAGVLRHAFARSRDDGEVRRIFGDGDAVGGSRLWVSWAKIHDAGDRPVDGLRIDLPADPVLENARAGSVRDHVRIGHRGAADDGGKFEDAVVCAGHRFSFELLLEGSDRDVEAFDWLLVCIGSGNLRLGGSSRRGLGRFKVVRCVRRTFDLRTESDARSFAALPARLDQHPDGFEAIQPRAEHTDGETRTLSMRLAAEGYWFVGGGDPVSDDERAPDMNPVREARIVWKKGRGTVGSPALLVPGSSIKGALSHRVAYHSNRLRGRFADTAEDLEALCGENNEDVKELFGHAKNGGDARVGRVFIDDIWLPNIYEQQLQRIPHTSLDRFTGGVRSGVLFDELAIFEGPPIEVSVHVTGPLSATAREALEAALRDLAEGRLSIGAGGGRGNGYFRLATGSFNEMWTEVMS